MIARTRLGQRRTGQKGTAAGGRPRFEGAWADRFVAMVSVAMKRRDSVGLSGRLHRFLPGWRFASRAQSRRYAAQTALRRIAASTVKAWRSFFRSDDDGQDP